MKKISLLYRMSLSFTLGIFCTYIFLSTFQGNVDVDISKLTSGTQYFQLITEDSQSCKEMDQFLVSGTH